MNISISKKFSQKGVALFVCLMILLVLSLLGITALRMMSTQTLMAASSQAADISYSAGASVINQVISQGELDLDARLVLPRAGEAAKTLCLISGQASAVDCSLGGAADLRGVSSAQVTVATIDPDKDTPAQAEARIRDKIKRVGNVPGAVAEYFTFTSQGSVGAMGISTTQTQESVFPHL